MGLDHTFRLYNSLGRRLEDFTPLRPDAVRMYTCGPTVYAFPHIGNMRAYVFADTLRRTLRWKGHEVRQVVNITDVGHMLRDADDGEDKLEQAARAEQRKVAELAAFYTEAFLADIRALNILPAAEYPRATAYVPQMIRFAEVLERRGFAYRTPAGLYFDTSRSPGYGTLAVMDVAGQREGARVENLGVRRNAADFAIWRTEAPGAERVLRWDSPWGWGAPGWHLECSVMSLELLGDHFDIHTGGVDHRELHHVNEIAQSEAYLDDGQPWVRLWMHNEFVLLGAEKMAKSAGGAPTLATLAEAGISPMVYRWWLVGAHYRSQVDFTVETLRGARAALQRLVARVAPLRPLPPVETLRQAHELLADGPEAALALLAEIDAAVSNDLNTAQVQAVLQQVLRADLPAGAAAALVAACDALLGLGLDTLTAADVVPPARDLSDEQRREVERLVAAREQARRDRDWAYADRIRDDLAARGVVLEDGPGGTRWHLSADPS